MEEVPIKSWEDIFDKVNANNTFARLIQMKLLEIEPGFARSILSITDQTVNISLKTHGRAIFSIANQACEAAGNSFGKPAVGLQHNIHFLAAGKSGDILEAIAKVTNQSNRFGLIEPRSWTNDAKQGK
jgi:acyl-CoA thioesterase